MRRDGTGAFLHGPPGVCKPPAANKKVAGWMTSELSGQNPSPWYLVNNDEMNLGPEKYSKTNSSLAPFGEGDCVSLEK